MTMYGHERDMRCVWNDLGECLAKVPQACLCRQMRPHEYKKYLERFNGRTDGELTGSKEG